MRIVSKLSTDLQKSKRENERIVSFFSEIFRLVRVMRSVSSALKFVHCDFI